MMVFQISLCCLKNTKVVKRILLLSLLFFAFSGSGWAQDKPSTKVATGSLRGEVFLGIGAPVYKPGAIRNQPRYMIGAELRYTMSQGSWDLGVGSRVGAFERKYSEGHPLYVSSEHYFVVDKNFYLNHDLCFFAGIEAGISVSYDTSYYNSRANPYGFPGVVADTHAFYVAKRVSPFIAPRIGIEVWNHLRCSLTFDVCDKGNSNFNFRIGYVF